MIDVTFKTMPNLQELNTKIKMITGVVEHSLFYKMATEIIVAESLEEVRIVKIKMNYAKVYIH